MEWFLKAALGILAAALMWIILSNRGKEYALVLSIGACCVALLAAFQFLNPVLDLLHRLQSLGNLQPEWLSVMLKAVGIGLVVEIGTLICTDAGNAVMGKTLQILGTIAVLWLCVPLMNSLMGLVEQILGGI